MKLKNYQRKNLLKKLLLIFFNLIFLCSFNSCTKNNFYESKQLIFGTILEIKFFNTDSITANIATEEIVTKLNSLNNLLHPWNKSSIYDLNQKLKENKIFISHDYETLKIILQKALEYENKTFHFFNPAIGKMIKLWGFHQDPIVGLIPISRDIQEVLISKPNLDQLSFFDDQQSISSSNDNILVDLGGFIKGYSLDLIHEILLKNNIENALINFGGNILALGKPSNRNWEIAIQSPWSSSLIAKLNLEPGSAIGTSGDYQKYFILNGKKFSHLINPFTGTSDNLYSSATVLIENEVDTGIKSDVYSKPLYFSNDPKKMAQKLNISNFMVTDHDRNIFISKALHQKIKFVNEYEYKTITVY